jgi:MFS family permease
MVLTSSPATPATRRTLTPQVAYALVASVIGLALFASATPSPLYGIYRDLWGFSPVVLTLVYATYAFGVLASLLLAGRVSDEVGRRPVLLVALGALLVTSVLFMVADSVAWLFVARGLQGLATGLALGAASAALLDLHPRRDPSGVGLTNGVASAGGIGLGVLVSATLVQLLPAPRVLPYVVLFVLFAVAFVGALLMPEPVADRSRVRLTPQRPSVPRSVRRPFFLAGLAVLSSWSVGGLFLSLGPQLSASLFDSTNHIVTGISVFVLAAFGSASQLAFGRRAPWAGAAGGSVALAAGTAIIVVSASTDSAVLLLIGSVVGGAGFGLAPPCAVGRDPAGPPRGRHVGLLRRGLHVAVDTGGSRRSRRDPAGARIDLRDPRKRRRGPGADRRRRGVAHAAAPLRRESGRGPRRNASPHPPLRSPARRGRSAGAWRG